MYTPKANEERRLPVLHQLIRQEPLAAFITLASTGLVATHLPFVLTEVDGEFGTLRGHIARANNQWQDLNPEVDALAIFSGPQHYITPSWYPGKAEDGKVVPTWNYVTVHAYGPLRIVHDEDWLLRHLEHLTRHTEQTRPEPWEVSDAPAGFIRKQVPGIVGFELPIRTLEGKWKVSQNRSERDKAAVAHGLAELGTADGAAMSEMVRERAAVQNS